MKRTVLLHRFRNGAALGARARRVGRGARVRMSVVRRLVDAVATPLQRSIHTRFRFAFGVSVASLVLMALIATTFSRAILGSYEYSVEHLRNETIPVLYLQRDLREVDHAAYGYAVKGEASEQRRFLHMASQVETRFLDLAGGPLIPSSAESHDGFYSIDTALFGWLSARAKMDEVFRHPAGSIEAIEAFKQAHFAVDPIYDGISDSQTMALDELQYQMSKAKQVGEDSVFVLTGAIVLGVGLLIFMVTAIGRSLLQPIEELRRAAGKLAEKDFSHRIRLRNTRDELGQLAAAINVASATLDALYRELEKRSSHDGLTGVLNRAAFDKRIEAGLIDADRRRRPVSLLMVDIDHFKHINDTYGHQAGDGVLRTVAALFEQVTRPADIIARYGGEEFAIILPETGREASAALAERLRALIEATGIERAEGGVIRLTVSIGCATRMPHGGAAEALIKGADAALYEAKHTGRNKVEQATPLLSQSGTAWQAA